VNCHDDMDCEKAFRLLDGYLDRSLNEEDRAQIEEHLNVCTRCACEYRCEETFVREVRAKLGRLQAPPELMDRIRAHLDQLASGS
jgi:anti-sigma factor (TIGR02949 family)